MATYNGYKTRMAAFREASHDSPWNIFPHKRSESLPQTYQASNDLEGQPLASHNTAPQPPTTSESEAKDMLGPRPETGESSAELRQADIQGQEPGTETGPATITQGTLRQRATGRDGSSSSTAENVKEPEKVKKSRTFFKHLTPKEPFTVRNQLQRTLFNSWINILLVAAPAGIAINYVPSVNRIAVFVVNFIAIVPLAAMLGFATEEIALRTGETIGGLLNATFGNAVELIIAIIALVHNEVVIVQTSLVGSILSNLLLVMGMCFFFGGLRRQEQYFNTTVAQTAASLLALAVAAVIVPTVFDKAALETTQSDIAKLSRGTSVILLIVYGAYLFFQLKTHSKVFAEQSQKVEAKPFNNPFRAGPGPLKDGAVAQGFVAPAGVMGGHGLPSSQTQNERMRGMLTNPPRKNLQDEDEEEEGEEPQLHFIVAVATLALSTVIIAFCAEFMVDSISAVTAGGRVSEEFVGLILLPIVGNAAEHATAVTVAIKDKMDLAIGVAIGSSMQVALFIIPLLVIIGWGMGLDQMALNFDVFQVAVLFVSVLLVNYLIADGKSHWLEGMLLMCLYIIIAVCSWWYPAVTGEGGSE
ncbi:Sodium/calcium exchanger protein-domain-containing protein [Achaetomium macrosporum]|uniref:Sodium/calcium exchanger protein-domain-containing protein n=1 Tax=Achaetomium macrosporum TaxID=79813 RepID=A0AAN7HC58_9PEZI|nr:Sodium/calcium exchanger protein-domain-containing protein [Achaetomium macrosporum]